MIDGALKCCPRATFPPIHLYLITIGYVKRRSVNVIPASFFHFPLETLSFLSASIHICPYAYPGFKRASFWILDHTLVTSKGPVLPQIIFEHVEGKLGLSLEAATAGQCGTLCNVQEYAQLGAGSTTDICIVVSTDSGKADTWGAELDDN